MNAKRSQALAQISDSLAACASHAERSKHNIRTMQALNVVGGAKFTPQGRAKRQQHQQPQQPEHQQKRTSKARWRQQQQQKQQQRQQGTKLDTLDPWSTYCTHVYSYLLPRFLPSKRKTIQAEPRALQRGRTAMWIKASKMLEFITISAAAILQLPNVSSEPQQFVAGQSTQQQQQQHTRLTSVAR